jgi:hypothetical protein
VSTLCGLRWPTPFFFESLHTAAKGAPWSISPSLHSLGASQSCVSEEAERRIRGHCPLLLFTWLFCTAFLMGVRLAKHAVCLLGDFQSEEWLGCGGGGVRDLLPG